MRTSLGKDFERELHVAAKAINAWSINSNDANPCCDRIMSIPVSTITGIVFGLSTLIEAKECRSASIAFDRISPAERANLDAHSRKGAGLSIIMIKLVCSKPRCWAAYWEDWTELESLLGFDPQHESSSGRRKRGTSSISLLDGERPPILRELHKIDRPSSLGKAWDLSPLIPEGLTLVR